MLQPGAPRIGTRLGQAGRPSATAGARAAFLWGNLGHTRPVYSILMVR